MGSATHLQNGHTLVVGNLHSAPLTKYLLDFYASTTADPSGFGQGQRYLGTVAVTTDLHGNANFRANLPAATTSGEVVSATATDPTGDTSEFSAVRIVHGSSGCAVSLSENQLLATSLAFDLPAGAVQLPGNHDPQEPINQAAPPMTTLLSGDMRQTQDRVMTVTGALGPQGTVMNQVENKVGADLVTEIDSSIG